MLFKQMKYFVAVVDCNSFTEAAEQCYISQSAISQQIQALEKELGVALLVRKNRRFSLTPAGEYFYSRCKGLLDEADRICRETVRMGQGQGPSLRIGCLRSYSGQELYQAVAEFSQLYPQVSISLVNGTHEELYNLLRFGRVDVILSDQRRAFSEEYENRLLSQCGCYAELSLHHPLSGEKFVQLEQLRYTPCILISSREQQQAEQEYYQNTLGFGGSFLFADNLEEGRLMVVSNRGFLPVEAVGALPPVRASVCRLPLFRGGSQLFCRCCLFWKKNASNPSIGEFARLLQKLIPHSEIS